MLTFGVNFSLYYLLLIGNIKEIFKNEELKRENNRLKTMLKIVVQSIKQFFHKISS